MHVVILGNGISGITAARYLRKNSDCQISVISAESEYFFSRTALMYIYMGHMQLKDTQPYEDNFWKKNNINLLQAYVENIDFDSKQLHTRNNGNIRYDKLIIATGSSSNKFGWPGQDLEGVGGLYSLQDLEYMERYSKKLDRAVIVGGGLIGIEMAEMFHSRHIPVSFLVRESSYWDNVLPKEESEMINRHILSNGIDLQLETELKEIVDDGKGRCMAVINSKDEKIECGYVGLTAGVHPNVSFLKETRIEINRGILVNAYLETNVEDVYAIGDCSEHSEPSKGRKPIEAVWYTGRMMGETVAYNVLGKKIPYRPGIWFNSAKFFNIEYQVYGEVSGKPLEHHASIYWENKEGDKSIRIVYDKNKQSVLGFNLMGIRYRHEVCQAWLHNETSVEEVLKNLNLADFDPEFYKLYSKELLAKYNQLTGKNIQFKTKGKLNEVFSFLKMSKI